MSKQRYVYWYEGQRKPSHLPSGCEALPPRDSWRLTTTEPEYWDWELWPHRWPVTEAEYRTHCYCEAYGIVVPEGWRVVDFRAPKEGEHWLNSIGSVQDCHNGIQPMRPILERVEEWIVPTDEDSQKHPMVDVRYMDSDVWQPAMLIAVRNRDPRFVVLSGYENVSVWLHCRMKKEVGQ